MSLLGANSKAMTNSTIATSASTTRSTVKPLQKKKDNFFVYSFKQLWSLLAGFWTRFRKFMWIGSTGNLFLIFRVHYSCRALRLLVHARNAK